MFLNISINSKLMTKYLSKTPKFQLKEKIHGPFVSSEVFQNFDILVSWKTLQKTKVNFEKLKPCYEKDIHKYIVSKTFFNLSMLSYRRDLFIIPHFYYNNYKINF